MNGIARPNAERIDARSTNLTFMQTEVDTREGRAHGVYAPNMPSPVNVIRIFGTTARENSVCVHVHGFEPYLWVEAPDDFDAKHCSTFRAILDAAVAERSRDGAPLRVRRVEMHKRRSIMFYRPEGDVDFLRVILQLPVHVALCRRVLEEGILVPGRAIATKFQTFESSIDHVLRFMVDTDIVGGNWITLPSGTYTPRTARGAVSTCQYEVDTSWSTVLSHATEGEHQKIAPLRILSFDIECLGREGHFPDPACDPVIQIASVVSVHGRIDEPVVRNVMVLDTCAPVAGAIIETFDDERELLRRWSTFVCEVDPDMMIGYNIMNFDFWYLIERAKTLSMELFSYMSRIRNEAVTVRDATFTSKAHGTRDSRDVRVTGRVPFDLMQAIQREHKLSSYSLNAVSRHFLGEEKEDVHHSAISGLHRGDANTRHRLAVYCLKDACLPQRLLDKLLLVFNYVEMARVTGVPIQYLFSRGQSIKVFSQLLRKAKPKGFVVPHFTKSETSDDKTTNGAGDVAYEGATVLDAKAGFYENPVATLDFASLYPSIMMAHNLCYSTLVSPALSGAPADADLTIAPTTGDKFVRPNIARGVLPEILHELLSARKRAREDIKRTDDPLLRAVLDGRQLALKVSANSVYGFTGAIVGKLPCLAISASTTDFGRQMIDRTRNMVESRYSGATVIYGDTDSVMIDFHEKDLRKCMSLGAEAADMVTETFPRPIKLEFEKVYWPYLLISKKRYAGVIWTCPERYAKMDTKGIETVRRDNCSLVRTVVETVLRRILIDRDVPGSVDYVKRTISELLTNRVDMSMLVITKGLSRDVERYETKMAHTELAKKKRKRDPASAPRAGDRVPYVIVKSAKGSKTYEKSEDPIYAMENRIPIDHQHYLKHYLEQPLKRIFTPIIKDVDDLFVGDHTRAVTNVSPGIATGIMRFARPEMRCLKCKGAVRGKSATCDDCVGDTAEVYRETLALCDAAERKRNEFWTECQRCQGSLTQAVLCANRDCCIFYRRTRATLDAKDAREKLVRFDW